MYILVTGGAGYIGSHTAKALASAGFTPVVLDNLTTGHKWAVRWGPLIEGDLGDANVLGSLFRRYPIKAVLHFAALSYVGESMVRPHAYFKNNVGKTLTLLEAMSVAGIGCIVFSSSCASYGVPEGSPISESHPQRPINPYGESKLLVERVLRWYGDLCGLRWLSLRYFNAAGADPEGEIGEAHATETHLIPLAIQVALREREFLEVYGTDYDTPDGTALRDYIHVSDLADAHVKALLHLMRGGDNLELNLGTGRGFSVREVISAVENVTEERLAIREVSRRRGDPAILVADARKAREYLSWFPRYTDLHGIVRTAWQWHRSLHGMNGSRRTNLVTNAIRSLASGLG